MLSEPKFAQKKSISLHAIDEEVPRRGEDCKKSSSPFEAFPGEFHTFIQLNSALSLLFRIRTSDGEVTPLPLPLLPS